MRLGHVFCAKMRSCYDITKPHFTHMTNTHIETREGLPHEMQALLRKYPRDAWPENPNFAASIQKWMSAHEMFRQLGALTQSDSEAFLDGHMDGDLYAARLSYYGNTLLRNLHGHHAWEDRSFFPELEHADPRFARGMGMLESDHAALDALLDRFKRDANRVVQLNQLDPRHMRDDAAAVFADIEKLGRFLRRHLSDEEDLAVPILLHHRMRG